MLGTMTISPLAGQPAPASMLVNVPRLVSTYYADHPDVAVAAERVAFGTSGHRGSALTRTFNEAHILAITQAICNYRASHGVIGPLLTEAQRWALVEYLKSIPEEAGRVTPFGGPPNAKTGNPRWANPPR